MHGDGKMLRCCLCGAIISGYGHNPWPLADGNSVCCGRCNATKVIPARLKDAGIRKE